MNEIIVKEEMRIENMIYEIRGKQVMLDSDLAILYKCVNGTKTINQSVKRHADRFPERFMFQLNNDELKFLWSQVGTTNKKSMSRTLPFVFTEQGVAMLATILRTEVASKVSIQIMDAFVVMRKYISENLIEQKYVNNLVFKHDEDIKLLQESFNKLSEKEKSNHIFFEGQVYNAYSLLLDIINKSKNEIIIIDNYAGKELLDILKDLNKKIVIISKNLNNELIKKYNNQYSNVSFIYNNSFHDRFIIIDKRILYHSGSSFKDLGKKCFAITRIDDDIILKEIIKKLVL